MQAERVEVGRVRLGGMGEMAAAEQHSGPYAAAVGSRQSTEITEISHPHQLGFGLGTCGDCDCCVTGSPSPSAADAARRRGG
ncbi:hypothetical protein SVIO_085240 [Streptomyces violaceusniger]|uniref:Uncharacterized protein n=1 Tax=Streptomyces violaceusniger TaxID=68280 RepID=A0A4D4L8K1_STRVO|nr:hypothetical protein SVIO_085240 [Streptomyces violaceusniger]